MKHSTRNKTIAAAAAIVVAVVGLAGGADRLNLGTTAADRGQINEGGTGSQVSGDGNQVAGPNGTVNRKDQTIGPGARGDGDTTATSGRGPANAGGSQANNDVGDGPRSGGDQYNGNGAGPTVDGRRTTQTTDTTTTAHGHGRVNAGSGSQNDSTINNYPAPRAEPPTPGVATMDAVAPADGGTTMGTAATFTITVAKLPTNGNRLFVVCNLLHDDPSSPDLYYARTELSIAGPQKLTLRFGGAYTQDPTLIGTTRTCEVWTADAGAAAQLARLMYLDSKHIVDDPDGVPYDVQRTSRPEGATAISKGLAVTIARVGS